MMAAASSTPNEGIATGDFNDISSSDNGKSTKSVFHIAQFGSGNKVIVNDAILSTRQTETEGIANSETGTREVIIQSDIVQIGDNCELHVIDELGNDARKAEVNSRANTLSICRRESLAANGVTTGKGTYENHSQDKEKASVTIDSPACLELCDQFCVKVLKPLHPLRDNGEWDAFDDKWNELMDKYGKDPAWNILLQLEKAIRICYHSKFELPHLDEAEKILRQVEDEIEKLEVIDPSIKLFCTGRLNCYLASVYRRQRFCVNLYIAHKCINIAEPIFQSTDNESFRYDKAIFNYEKGSLFDQMGVDNKSTKEMFDKCNELCRQLKTTKGWEFVKKGQFAQLKKATHLFECSTKQARKRRIADEDLEEANECINEFDRDSRKKHGRPISEQVQLLIAKSYQFSIYDYDEAEKLVCEAIKLADEHGFDSKTAHRRLQDIQDASRTTAE